MTGPNLVLLIAAICLIPAAGGLAAVDAALARVSVARIEELVRENRRGSSSLARVVADRARHTNLLLLLRVAAELTATVFATLAAVAEFGSHWPVVLGTIVVMVVVSYVLIGVGPRTLGRQHPYAVALAGARIVLLLGRVFGPLASLLILIGNAITPGRGYREGPFSSEAELRELVDMAEARGVVERGEREMIQSVFELGSTIAREVMVPRTDVVWIESTKTVPQALALALRSGFSRIPVVADNIDDVVGLVYLKDVIRRAQDPERARQTKIDEVMRTPTFVPESKPVDELLREMQARNSHMAIVIDEYGGTAGLVTIEDILEEIVGEIRDEYDVERPPVEELPDGAYRLTARLPVEDLGELFDVELPRGDDVETVGGLMAQLLGRVPIPGSSVTAYGLQLTAVNAGGRRNRIDTVLASKLPESDAGGNDDD
ncbi:MAG: magnesium and cobalt exporter, family [Pseudonocardiales bacterium]|jgi:CBS domain containing-hemolysin-like protein|nr:magnesium and cobalt exporter, family [Pseudonocardiales bacterium]MDQ1736349.1 magnesium and cobalt exporter, family [Pseudonocardiales bacterium]